MHKKIEQIKKTESNPKVIKNLYTKEEIEEFLRLYNELPTTVHNKKQNVIKKSEPKILSYITSGCVRQFNELGEPAQTIR